jgi:hypothetical protein
MFTRQNDTRKVAHGVVPHIAASLPNLERMDWDTDDRTVHRPYPEAEWIYQFLEAIIHNRVAFAYALENCPTRPRSTANIDFVGRGVSRTGRFCLPQVPLHVCSHALPLLE